MLTRTIQQQDRKMDTWSQHWASKTINMPSYLRCS